MPRGVSQKVQRSTKVIIKHLFLKKSVKTGRPYREGSVSQFLSKCFLFCWLVSRPVCFYLFIYFSDQFFFFFFQFVLKLTRLLKSAASCRRNLFLKMNQRSKFWSPLFCYLNVIGCVYNSRQAAQQSCMWPSFKVGAWEDRKKFPSHSGVSSSVLVHLPLVLTSCRVVGEVLPIHLGQGLDH